MLAMLYVRISIHGLWVQCAVYKSAKEGVINHSEAVQKMPKRLP